MGPPSSGTTIILLYYMLDTVTGTIGPLENSISLTLLVYTHCILAYKDSIMNERQQSL